MSLTNTRLSGERMREEWLLEMAQRSKTEGWTIGFARTQASNDVMSAQRFGHIGSPKTVDNMIAEGVLAAHPDVRTHMERLKMLRDQLWETESRYLRQTLHGPSQTLLELMRRQKRPDERHHTADAATFLRYLRNERFPDVPAANDSGLYLAANQIR